MTHVYTRHCYRVADGFTHSERVEMSGEQVAMQTRKSGDRADFLELLNRWNRANIGDKIGHNGYIYVYVLEVTSR